MKSNKQTRRKFIKSAVAVPSALLAGCCTTKNPADGSRSTLGVKSCKRGGNVLSKSCKNPPFPPKGPDIGRNRKAIAERITWDFDKLLCEIVKRLEKGKTDTEVKDWVCTIPQHAADPNGRRRNLNVKVDCSSLQMKFEYADDAQGNKCVTGVTLIGCMARYTGVKPPDKEFDDPFEFEEGKTCEDAKNAALLYVRSDDPEVRTHHLVSSSSSSSSNWGVS